MISGIGMRYPVLESGIGILVGALWASLEKLNRRFLRLLRPRSVLNKLSLFTSLKNECSKHTTHNSCMQIYFNPCGMQIVLVGWTADCQEIFSTAQLDARFRLRNSDG